MRNNQIIKLTENDINMVIMIVKQQYSCHATLSGVQKSLLIFTAMLNLAKLLAEAITTN